MQSHVALLRRNRGLVVRGVMTILFGLTAFLIRRGTLAVLIAIFAMYAFGRQYGRPWRALSIVGLAGIATAGIALLLPGLAALTLVVVIGSWAIALGVTQSVAAGRLGEQGEGMAVPLRRMTRAVLIAIFAAYALFRDGILALIAATRREYGRPWWARLVVGLAGIATAGVALFMPGLAALTLALVIAGWVSALSVQEIVAALRLREETGGEWILCFESGAAIGTPLHAPSERTELPVAPERTGRSARRRTRVRAIAQRAHGEDAGVERELAGVEGPLVAPAQRERAVV
jgi:uncharacterized membrane protein HdeD (DUF308 family)